MKWKDVVSSPKYQAYSPEEKEKTRERFWNEIVAPNIKESERDNAYLRFNEGADRIEGINATPLPVIDNGWTQELASLDPAFREQIMRKAQRDGGFLKALQQGKFASTSARLAMNYAPDTAAGRATKEARESGWEPETGLEAFGQEAAALAFDLPLYAAGGVVGGISGLGNPISTGMGAMGLPYALNELMEKKEQAAAKGEEFNPTLSDTDTWDILKEEGKGIALGGVLGQLEKIGAPVANRIAKAIPDKVKSKTPEFVKNIAMGAGKEGSINVAQTATMLGAENVMSDVPITTERAGRNFMLNAFMRSMHTNPKAKQKVQDAINKGLKADEIVNNIDPAKIDPAKIKDPVYFIEAIDEAIFKTEKQIELQKAAKIQDTIVENQIRANYKDGKTPQEILQVNQIPKEYRPFILDQTEAGGYKFKPDVLKKVDDIINRRDITSQKYEDVLPGTIRDMYVKDQQRVLNEYNSTKESLDGLREHYKRFREEAPKRREEIINKHIDEATGNYRRYESLPEVREKMDAVMGFVDSVLTPEDKFNVVLDPSTLMDHVNYKESGYSQLKKPYQDAVKKEIVAKYIQETGFIPPHVIEAATRKADSFVRSTEKRIIEQGKATAKALDHISKSSEYQQAAIKSAYEAMTPEQRAATLKETLKSVEQWATEEKALHLINFKKAMGESESFGALNRNNKEFFGETHYADTLEFAQKSPAQVYKELSKANYLKRDLLFKGLNFHDTFLNKSRVAKNYLGKHIYDAFVAPLRQVERNFIHEFNFEKKEGKQFKKDFKLKERDQMGEHIISLDPEGLATLKEMGIEAPTWEQLTDKQRAKLTEWRQKMDVTLERINLSRADVGLKPIERREGYITFMRKFTLAEELGYDLRRISPEEFNKIQDPSHNMKHYASPYLKERIGGTRALETDIAFITETYMNSALKTIHYTPVIGKLRLALNHEEGFREANPNAHKFLHDYLDAVAGKKVSETIGAINAAISKISRNVGVFTLAYNLRSAMIQPTAIVNAGIILGPINIAKGLKDYMNPKLREFARRESKVIGGRSMDATVEQITRGAKGVYGKVQSVGANFGTLPLRVFDVETATVTWLSAYKAYKTANKTAKKEGIDHRKAVVYADDIVNSTQASASRIDLAPIQHTPAGKALTLFNTFIINNLNFLIEDVAGFKKVHKLVEQGIPYKQAKAKYGATDTITIQEIKGKAKVNAKGEIMQEPSTAVVYDTMRMVDKKVAIERTMRLFTLTAACNTIYELMGMDPPLPAPLSAFYEGLTGQSWVDALKGKVPEKEGNIAKGFHELWKEMMTVFPVFGGSFTFGGESVAGPVAGLVIDTVETLGGLQGSKPLPYILGKWAGVPGGQQVYKMIKAMARAEKEEEKEKRKASPQYIRQQIKKDMIKSNPGLQEYQQIKKDLNKLKRGY